MTVIASIWDGKNPVHLLSDVLLSAEGDVERSISLPHLPSVAKIQAGSSTLVGVTQKTVTLGNTAFVWAGKAMVAAAIMKEFFDRSEGGTKYVALSGVIQSLNLTNEEKESVGIMTFFCDRPSNIVTNGHNMSHYKVGLGDGSVGRITTVGSGSWDLIENYKATRLRPIEYSLPIDIIHRMGLRTVEPFLNEEGSFHYLYGSWFELSAHRELAFHKLPMALKFWFRPSSTEPFEDNGPLVFSTYLDEDLFVTTIVRDGETSLFKTIHMPDPLGRGRALITNPRDVPDEALQFRPELFFHALLTGQGEGKSKLRVAPFFVDGDPLLTVSRPPGQTDNQIEVTIDPELAEFIGNSPDEVDLEVDHRLHW